MKNGQDGAARSCELARIFTERMAALYCRNQFNPGRVCTVEDAEAAALQAAEEMVATLDSKRRRRKAQRATQ
jgi:hypothetical protein